LKNVRTSKTFKNLFKNNNEKLELLNSFQKLIFNEKSAAPLKLPPGARAPVATPLGGTNLYCLAFRLFDYVTMFTQR